MIRAICSIVLCCSCLLFAGCFPDIPMVRRMEQRSIERTSAQTTALSADHRAIAEVVAPAAVPIIDANQADFAKLLAANREEADDDEGGLLWKMLTGLLATAGGTVYASRKMSGSGARIDRTEDGLNKLKDEVLRNMPPPTSS